MNYFRMCRRTSCSRDIAQLVTQSVRSSHLLVLVQSRYLLVSKCFLPSNLETMHVDSFLCTIYQMKA